MSPPEGFSCGPDTLAVPALHRHPIGPMAGGLAEQSELFPPSAFRRGIDNWLTDALANAADLVRAGPVHASADMETLLDQIRSFDFATPQEAGDVLSWVISRMMDGVVHINHPRYFGLFNPTPTFPAQCAERIVAAFNPQLATATTSPFPVALEAHLIKAIAGRAGMPETAFGHFTNGGTEANATALICALTQFEPNFAQAGVRALRGKPALYTSRDAHLAWLKLAHQTGIGRAAVRLVATDGTGRMDPERLAADVAADVANGFVPVMIASTAGTTGAGMIDPLADCGAVARQFGAWHHVDAAWGGAALFSDRLRPVLGGIEAADSVTIDAHKWLATTMGCGMFLTAHPSVMGDAFQVVMSCMPSNAAGLDPYVTTVQWSRRFLGLRLFVGLATAGWGGYAAHLEHSIRLAGMLEGQLLSDGWSRLNNSRLAVLCMRPPAGAADARTIAQAVVRDGAAWVSMVEFEGEAVVRFCVTSGEATEADITQLVQTLRNCM